MRAAACFAYTEWKRATTPRRLTLRILHGMSDSTPRILTLVYPMGESKLDRNQHFYIIVLDPRARSCLLTLNGSVRALSQQLQRASKQKVVSVDYRY